MKLTAIHTRRHDIAKTAFEQMPLACFAYSIEHKYSEKAIIFALSEDLPLPQNASVFEHVYSIIKKQHIITNHWDIRQYTLYKDRQDYPVGNGRIDSLDAAYKAWYIGKYQYKNYFEPCIVGGLHQLTVYTAQHNLRVLLANYGSFYTLMQNTGYFVHVVPGNKNEKMYFRALNKHDLFSIEMSDNDNNEYNLLTTKRHIVNMVNNPIYENWHITNDNGDWIMIEDINTEQLQYGICSNDQIFDGDGNVQDIADCIQTMDDEYYLKDECIQFDVGQYKGQWTKHDDDHIVFGHYGNDQEGWFHYHDEYHEINGECYHESYYHLNRCDECYEYHLTGDYDHYSSECGEYTFCSSDCMVEHHSYRSSLDGLSLHDSRTNIVNIYGYGDSSDYIKGEKQYIGIELELDVIDGEGEAIQDITDSSRQWIAKEDGSLESNGFELNSIPMGMDEILNAVDNLILTEDLRSYTDAPRHDYGLHIHVSKAQLSAFEVFKIQELTINLYNRVLIALNGFVASGYAKPIRQYNKTKCNGKNYVHKTEYSRYSLCNITDHTLEFRYPRATLDTLRLKANIEACKALAHYAMSHNMLECKHENAYKAFALFVCQNKHIYKNLVKYAEQENLLGMWGI